MTRRPASLRQRLFALILIPLVVMAMLLGVWRTNAAQRTSDELFDRTLLSAALAISRDVAVSGGDHLSISTRDMIQDASGGEVFYHATGPGGSYITGYAYPPATSLRKNTNRYVPNFFEAEYRQESVRVLRITERMTIENLTGDATVTVWQRLADRHAFARQLALRAAALIGALLVTLALVVWFGVALGLRPLLDLQDAISIRSPDDLSQIRRPVPIEAQGILRTLNRLFGQVETTMNAHQAFISDAAHQLRNPAAAVQSMAEAVRDAPTNVDKDMRIAELVSATRQAARIADQLLSMDRLQQPVKTAQLKEIDLPQLVHDACADMGPLVLSKGIAFELKNSDQPIQIRGDSLFLAEAIKNLIDNALKHAGAALNAITVQVSTDQQFAHVTVTDDGKGLSPEQTDTAFRRFSQVEPSEGSGLGLSIAQSVAKRHGGVVSINRVDVGASLTLSVRLAP